MYSKNLCICGNRFDKIQYSKKRACGETYSLPKEQKNCVILCNLTNFAHSICNIRVNLNLNKWWGKSHENISCTPDLILAIYDERFDAFAAVIQIVFAFCFDYHVIRCGTENHVILKITFTLILSRHERNAYGKTKEIL